jgi:DNA adenine methylase
VNSELIDAYVAIRDHVNDVIAVLKDHKYESDYYYKVREQKRDGLSLVENAARTIFLNKTGYNGLYRVNRSGQFNVPFGRFTNPAFCDVENLRACSRALRNVSIVNGDYSSVLEKAKKGDFVYFDPPYDPVTPTASFTSYTANVFGPDQQRELAETARMLVARGCKVMLSNSDTPFIRSIYKGFTIDRVKCSRAINSNAAKRGDVDEVIATAGY